MDTCNARVIKTKIDGSGWTAYGTSGSGTGQFSTGSCNTGDGYESRNQLFYDSVNGYLYATDAGNNRIVKTKIDGTGWTTYSDFGSGHTLSLPQGVFYDVANNYLYIANAGAHNVIKTRPDGTGWTTLAGFGWSGQLYYDSVSDYIYVADGGSNVIKTKIDGSGWATLAGFSSTRSLFFNSSDGTLYVANTGANNIIKTQFDGTGWTTYGSYAANPLRIGNVGDVYYDSLSGYYYIADTSNHRIVKEKVDGTGWQTFGSYGTGVNQFDQPTGIYYDNATGYLYITDRSSSGNAGVSSRMVKTKIDGTGWTSYDLGGQSRPYQITYDSTSDYLYFTDGCSSSDCSGIGRMKKDGSNFTRWTGYGLFGSNQPTGIAYDPTTSYVYVASGGTIYKTQWGGAGWTTWTQAAYFLQYDSSAGYFYFTNAGSTILKSQWGGTNLQSYGSNGSGVGNFSGTYGLSYDVVSGYYYVADWNNTRIVRTKIDGSGWATTNDYTSKEKILYSAQATDDSRLVYDVASRKLRFYLAYSNKAQFVETPTLSLTDGDWYTVKASFNKAAHTLAIDLNGVNQATNTYDTDWGSLSYGTSFYIGARNGSTTDRWDGMIDDVNISSDAVDTTTPTNPTVAHVYSTSGKTTEFTDTNWGNDLDPYITFSGAADADSGVKGYYIYFGTADGTDPVSNSGVLETAGAFHYQAHVGASGDEQHVQVPASALVNGSTYYLLVKTQDNDLNVSSSVKHFTYKADAVVPSTNPTALAYNDSGKATPLTTNTWYNYAHPYFELSGAADTGGSAIKGYYVYFGTSVNADPLTDGTLVQVANYTASATLVNGTTYYMKVKTADNAGNVIATSDTLFTYRYTNDAPTSPTVSGYDTASKGLTLASDNWYSYENPYFDWIGASSTPGIAGYYVYFGTNASADPTSVGAYQVGSTYQTVAAMTAGQTYYLNLKAKDNANNISDNVQFVYKFDNEAPLSNPTSFAGYDTVSKGLTLASGNWANVAKPYFEWDGAQDTHSGVKGYYVYFGTDASATPLTAGTFQTAVNQTIDQVMTSGSTYYFILQTVNNANTPSSKHTYFNYKYDSAAPALSDAINVSPQGCSISPTFDLTWQAAVDPSPGSGFSTYEYKAGSQGQVHPLTDLAISVPSYQDGDNVFYLRAKDNAGNTSSWQTAIFCSTGVAQIIDGPRVTAGPASLTTTWTSSKPTKGSVIVYEGNEYISEQTGGEFDVSHSVKVVGLEPEKAYRYQLKWYDQSGNSGMSDFYQTTTSTAPSVKNFVASVVSTDRAVLSWGTTENSTGELQYGKDSPSTTVALDGNASNFSKDLTDLTGGSTYQVRVSARTMDGFPYYYTASFETPPMPAITGLRFESSSPSTTKVTWNTNVDATSTVFYGEKGQVFKELTNSEKVKTHAVDLSGLSDNMTYELYAQGSDQFGNTAKSDTNSFSTPLDTTPPIISDVTIETSNVGLNRQDKAQVAISWKTNKLATSQVEYGEGLSGDQYTSKSTEDKALSDSHVVVISDLQPSQPYHIRINSTDKNGNTGKSDDQAVIPGEVQRSVLQTLLQTFNSVFGWMNFLGK